MADGNNIVKEKAEKFAIRIVKCSRFIRETKREYSLADQLLRCGTSIGANLYEAEFAQSKADFISKMSIALKEASETKYWLWLLHRHTGRQDLLLNEHRLEEHHKSSCLNIEIIEGCRQQEIADNATFRSHYVSSAMFNF